MKPTTILYLALAPLGLAASIADAANPMAMVGFTKRDHKKHDHKGRVADFREACNCPPVNCPSFLSKAEICRCENAAAQACSIKANGGCQKPLQRC